MKSTYAFASLVIFASLFCWTSTVVSQTPEGFTSLFDGKSLDGWEQKNGTATFEVVDGTIKGTTAPKSPNSFLCTKKDYANFELHFEVKVHKSINSGVQIRSLSNADFENGRVHGPQVEIESDPGESGYLYSEGTGRHWISPTQSQKNVFNNDDWNQYRVIANGNRIQTWINGTAIEDVETSKEESLKGFIGLQVHQISEGKGPYSVQWRNIHLRELDGEDTRKAVAYHGTPTIDGKIDDVWKDVPRLVTSREVEEHNNLAPENKVSTASVRCLWDDGHLYCLAEVKDDAIKTNGGEEWQNDSVEFFIDGNMARAASYDSDDAQYRTDADGTQSGGDSSDLSKYESVVTKVEGGYIIEACIDLATEAGKEIGFDVQVNNNVGDGTRASTAKWNDPTNDSYLNTSGFGTLKFAK